MLRIRQTARANASLQAWVEIDLGAVQHNVCALRGVLPPACELIAVVKANAYGHGIVPVARTALAAGAARLAVGSPAEGIALRQAGIGAPILITGPTAPEQATDVVAHGLTPAVATRQLALALAAAATAPLPVEVEVDTGMRRHGIRAEAAAAFCRAVHGERRLRLDAVYTHFAPLQPDGLAAMQAQIETFAAVRQALARTGVRPRAHACNTLGALLLPAAHLDAVRIGGGLYGFDPLRGRGPVALRPALALKCRIAAVRAAGPGEPVGYGGAFVCGRPSRLALLPLGYADGLARAIWSGAEVLVRGRRAQIVGLVSMNLTIADVTDVPAAAAGDEVVLLGEQDGERIAAEDRVAPGGSVYEVTALLRSDLPRVLLGEPAGSRGHDRSDAIRA
jgi:alanine racemase